MRILKAILNGDWNKDCPKDDCNTCEYNHYNNCYKPETIKAEYNGYTGYAYGASSFLIRDQNDNEIFHSGFCNSRPQTEAECIEYIKQSLELIEMVRRNEC